MMEQVREWLLALLSVCLVCALADALMPKGGVKRVGQLVCGLAMTAAILAPVVELDLDGGQQWLEDYFAGISRREEELEKEVNTGMKTIIEQEYAAYIVDKAAELGAVCDARVECRLEEAGLYLPERAEISGAMTEEVRTRLTRLLEEELALTSEQIVYIGGEEAA